MREIAPGVHLEASAPHGQLLHRITAHAVTLAHPEHFGSSRAVCEAMDLPLWCGAKDAEAIETATPAIGPGCCPSC